MQQVNVKDGKKEFSLLQIIKYHTQAFYQIMLITAKCRILSVNEENLESLVGFSR